MWGGTDTVFLDIPPITMDIKDVPRKVPNKTIVTIGGQITGFLDESRYIFTDPTGSLIVYFTGKALEWVEQKSIVDSKMTVTGMYIFHNTMHVLKISRKEDIQIS